MPKRISKTTDGFFRRAPNGPWYATIGGKEYSTKKRDLTAARMWRRTFERRAASGPDDTTIEIGLKRWLQDLEAAGIAELTIQGYARHLGKWAELWGWDFKLIDITPELVMDAVVRWGPKTPVAVAVRVKCLVSMLKHLKRIRLWKGDAAELRPRGLRTSKGKHTRFLTLDEIWRVIRESPTHRGVFFALSYASCARISEVNESVRYRSNIDLKRMVIRVKPGKTRKVEGSIREVPILSVTEPLVRWALEHGAEGEELCPAWYPSGLRRMPRTDKSSVAPFSANDLRRSLPTVLVRAGVSDRIVARLLGHSGTQVLQRHYTDLDVDSARSLIEGTLRGLGQNTDMPCADPVQPI